MYNDQAIGYGLLALKRVLDESQLAISDNMKKALLKDFAGEMHYMFDMKTEEEANKQGWALLD